MNNKKMVKISKIEADKRLIKYFTSRLLFLLLALLFVWYGCSMFVHADSGSTLMSIFDIDSSRLNTEFVPAGNYSNNKAFFNPYDYGYCVTNYMQDYIGSNDHTNFHPPYDMWDSYVEPVDFSGVDTENNFIICCSNYFSGIGRMTGYILIPKDLFLDGKVLFYRGGYLFATEDFNYQVYSTWTPLTTRTFIADGSSHIIDLQQANSTANCYFCSCPYWDGIGFVSNSSDCIAAILENNNNPFYHDDTLGIFNSNYFMYDDISNMADSFTPDVETESNKNHLYFEDVQIGLTSQGGNMNILESSVVIGVEVDDWVKNHINDYWVYVSYRVHIKDSDLTVSDPNTVWSQYLPLRTFYNDAYTCGVSEIFQQAPVTGYTNFLNYYNHIITTHSIEVTNQNGIFNSQGIFPSIMRLIGFNIGDYKVTKDNIPNYSIFDFGLEVRVVLTDNAQIGESNTSGVYAKDFNFLNGTSSITKAEGLVNNNPWIGESEPQENPIVPSSGNGLNPSINGGGFSTNNVQVNSYSKVPMNVQSKQELNNALSRYTEVTQYFNNYFKELSEVQNENSYLYFLGQTIPMIPGVKFMISSAMVVFALAVILFVLKVLLF